MPRLPMAIPPEIEALHPDVPLRVFDENFRHACERLDRYIGALALELAANLEPGDWDMPEDVWKALEEETRPEEEYLTWFNRTSYARFFAAADFHDERAELP
jgi:hypothetical protein